MPVSQMTMMKIYMLVCIAALLIVTISGLAVDSEKELDVTEHQIQKRAAQPNKTCQSANENELYQDPENSRRVWRCENRQWVIYRLSLFEILGSAPYKAAPSCKAVLKQKVILNECDAETISSKAYHIKLTDNKCPNDTTTETVQSTRGADASVQQALAYLFCEMDIDGGGWALVWKHSVLEVGTLSTNMYYHSKHYRPCTDIETGWCNIPNKYRLNPTEMLHVGYYNKQIVYAYKGRFNLNIDNDWTGGFLLNSTKLVDRCTQGNGIPPMPKIYSGDPSLLGLDFAKRGIYQNERESYCDGYYVSLSSPGECRWWDCLLPTSISSKSWGTGTQRTTAIYVR